MNKKTKKKQVKKLQKFIDREMSRYVDKKHYVYKLVHNITGEYYYGLRSTKRNPYNDSYMGSSAVWKFDRQLVTKKIIKICKTRMEAAKLEIKLIEKYFKDFKYNRNFTISNVSTAYKEKFISDNKEILYQKYKWKDILANEVR